MSSNFSFSQRRFSLAAETGVKTDEPFCWGTALAITSGDLWGSPSELAA